MFGSMELWSSSMLISPPTNSVPFQNQEISTHQAEICLAVSISTALLGTAFSSLGSYETIGMISYGHQAVAAVSGSQLFLADSKPP